MFRLPFAAVVFLITVLVAISVCLLLPGLVAKQAPAYIKTHMASFIEIEKAEFKHSPPELILHKVRLQDPQGFGGGDALRIDRVNVTFAGYGLRPIEISALTFHNVRGEYKKRDEANNFAILLQQLMERKGETPRGVLAFKTKLDHMAIYRSSVQSEDASALIPLADKEFKPTGALENIVPLQYVIADALGAVIVHEQEAADLLTVEQIKEKTRGLVQSIGDAVKEYLTTP